MRVEGNELRGAALAGDDPEKSRGAHKRKTKFCMFHLQGVCQFGAKCAFAHSVDELQKESEGPSATSGTTSTTSTTSTTAHSDEEARPIDMFYKKAPCLWYERGRCRKGEQCRFAHGAEELRKYGDRQPKAAAEKGEDVHRTQRRPDANRGNRQSASGGGATLESRVVASAGGDGRTLSTMGAPGLDTTDLIKGSRSNLFEPMFVQPMSSPITPMSAPPPGFALPPPGLAPMVFQPAPGLEQEAFYNMYANGPVSGKPSSLVEGLKGLADAPVEELRREWEMMEQHQKALEAATLGANNMYCGAQGPPLSTNIHALLQLKQLNDDKARYAYAMDMQSHLVGA